MKSQGQSVEGYLAELPKDRRREVEQVRQVILRRLPAGYREVMQYGMIGYVVPLDRYPQGYLGKRDTPLPYLSLGVQKNHIALYLTNVYQDQDAEAWFKAEYAKTGKKLDLGKSCLRFKTVDDLPLDLIGRLVERTSVDETIERYEEAKGFK